MVATIEGFHCTVEPLNKRCLLLLYISLESGALCPPPASYLSPHPGKSPGIIIRGGGGLGLGWEARGGRGRLGLEGPREGTSFKLDSLLHRAGTGFTGRHQSSPSVLRKRLVLEEW